MAAYPERVLVRGERVLEHLRPHGRMLVVPVLTPPLLALPTAFVAALVSAESWRMIVWVTLGVLAGGLAWWFCLAPLARWWCTHLVVTDRRVLVREGVVSRSGIDLPGSEITSVRMRQTLLERSLGCGTLVVATRATPGPTDDERWEFDGIPHLARVAATVEDVAERRGGLDEPDDADEPDEPDEASGLDDDVEEPTAGGGSRLPVLRRPGRMVRASR